MRRPFLLLCLVGLCSPLAAFGQTRTFSYDGVGRLVAVQFGEEGGQQFQYDVAGNLLAALRDADGDSMSDEFEQLIIERVTDDRFVAFIDVLPSDDFDDDGLTNLEEYEQLSDPAEGVITFIRGYDRFLVEAFAGVTDLEVIGLAADPDRDGLSNLREYIHYRDPMTPDGGALVVSSREGSLLQITTVLRADDAQIVHFAASSMDMERWERVELVFEDDEWSASEAAPFAIVDQTQILPGVWRLTLREEAKANAGELFFLRFETEVIR